MNQTCIEGHIGAFCEGCDLYSTYWNQSYANSDSFSCGICSNISNNVLKIVGISTYTTITMAFSVKGTFNSLRNKILLIPLR